MKKIIYFFSFVFMFFALQSCDEQLEIIDVESIELKGPPVKYDTGLSEDYYVYEGETPYLCAEGPEYNLIAGQNTDAGYVKVGNDGTDLYIKVHSTFGFQDNPENVKIWIGTNDDNIPSAGNGQPIPGQFPIKETVAITDDTITFKIPLEDIFGDDWVCDDLEKLYIVVHADVLTDDSFEGSPETAWGCECEDCDFEQGERWWCAIEYTPECCDDCMDAFGIKDKEGWYESIGIDINSESYCGWINKLPYNEYFGYDLDLYVNDDCIKATKVGNFYIKKGTNDSELQIKYTAIGDYLISEINFYIGSSATPGTFTKVTFPTPVTTTEFFTVPWGGGENVYVIPHVKICESVLDTN